MVERYIAFDVETPNSNNDRMSAIGPAMDMPPPNLGHAQLPGFSHSLPANRSSIYT